jgi:ABC-type transport system involved in Fe-S cluster assembly fused permease/ATPase subunit
LLVDHWVMQLITFYLFDFELLASIFIYVYDRWYCDSYVDVLTFETGYWNLV